MSAGLQTKMNEMALQGHQGTGGAIEGFRAPEEALNILRILQQRMGLIIVMAIIGLVAGGLFTLRVQQYYAASVDLMVLKKKGEIGGDFRTAILDDYVQLQVTVIKSDQVLKEAATLLQQGEFASGVAQAGGTDSKPLTDATSGGANPSPINPFQGREIQNIIDYLKGGITVTKAKEAGAMTASNNVLQIRFQSVSNTECVQAVKAIVKGYKNWLDLKYNLANDMQMTRLERTVTNSRRESQQMRDDLRQVEEQLQKNSTSGVVFQQRVLQDKASGLINRLDRVKARQEELTDQMRLAGTLSQADLLPSNADNPASEMNLTRNQEIRLIERKVKQLTRQGLGKDHPDVKNLNEEIAEIKSYNEKLAKGLIPKGPDGKPSAFPGLGEDELFSNKAQGLLQHYGTRIEEYETELGKVKDELLALQTDLDKHKEMETKKIEFNRKIERADREVEFTEQMKQQYLMTKEHGGYEAQELGRIPEIGSEIPSRKSLMVVAGGIFGAALGGGLAWLLERSDRTFRSPEDIRQRLGLPVLGHVPLFPPMDEEEKALCKVDPSLICFHNPKSQEAEFFRGLRTALYFSTQGQGNQVLQTTSPTAGDGKSTTSANLAISIAQSGKKIVLLDADFRKPRVHKIFRLEQPEVGLASVVNGDATLQEAIHTCEVPGLHLMPCGPRPANPSELLTSPRFSEVIEELRKLYDIVMVDTPPILAVSDPSIVAPRVDGVLMVMRVTRNGRPAAEQAAEILGTLGAKVLGVVINGYDPREAGKYGYGYGYGYKYSYGYKYGYKYNYGYNYTDYESYTDDEDEENEAANAEGKEKRGPSMASRVLPNLIPRIQTKRLPSKPASETKPPETPEST